MFDFVHKNKRIVQFILALMVLPFAFVGVDSYVRNMSSDKDVAVVGGQGVTPQDFDNALRSQQNQMRNMLGKNFDPAMFDNPEVRQQVLDGLVNQRLLAAQGQDLKLTAPDAKLQETILAIPDFQDNGKFSSARYDEVLKLNGLNRMSYEQRLRTDLAQVPVRVKSALHALLRLARSLAAKHGRSEFHHDVGQCAGDGNQRDRPYPQGVAPCLDDCRRRRDRFHAYGALT